ncbi:unnamed protein product [Porites lobata]|uniref:Uncharacterized protein n=1 Tax=Porites lobata TaxID=104759 RepID=A0ABN8QBF2_9CNID|nr:unnamed protein product [Porites lobata]
MSHSQLVDAHCVGTNCVVLISKNRIISFTMDKFAKGFLSLLVNGARFTLLQVLLPGISTDKSGGVKAAPSRTPQIRQTTDDDDDFVIRIIGGAIVLGMI